MTTQTQDIPIPVVDGYDIDKEILGWGGMGFVCRARSLQDGREYAIKFLHAHMALDPELVKRFQAESEACMRLRHPNIVRVYHAGLASGERPYFIMEMLDGRPLASVLKERGALPDKEVVELLSPVLEALSHAHAMGYVHRDIKPGNIFLCADGSIRLLDFGIAKAMYGPSLSMTGTQIGSPDYMSPEQAELKHAVDARSDLYSLGIVMYEALSGSLPFTAENPLSVLMMHVNNPPPSLPATVSKLVRDVVAKALSKQPEDRYATADAMLEALAPGTRNNYYKLENFEIGDMIGRGGMGEVYRARHAGDGRVFAIKFMRAEMRDTTLVRMFLREGDVCLKLLHPNIVRVYHAGVEAGRPYHVMDLLQGESLSRRLSRDGRLSEPEAVSIAERVLEGLECAHSLGYVHRDIKPGNIFLCSDGTPKLLDFGAVKALNEYTIAATGTQIGTPEYMSPEQIDNRLGDVTPRSDVYGMGIVLYELLAGSPPFIDENPLNVARMHLETKPAPIDGISEPVSRVLDRSLMKQPEQRYATATDMLVALTGNARRRTVEPRQQEPQNGTASTATAASGKRWSIGVLASVWTFIILVAAAGAHLMLSRPAVSSKAAGSSGPAAAVKQYGASGATEASGGAQAVPSDDAHQEEAARLVASAKAGTDSVVAKLVDARDKMKSGSLTESQAQSLSDEVRKILTANLNNLDRADQMWQPTQDSEVERVRALYYLNQRASADAALKKGEKDFPQCSDWIPLSALLKARSGG